MKKQLLAAAMTIALYSCHSEKAEEKEPAAGVYSGIVPCADCMGIEYTLYLQADSTYFLRQIYYKEPVSDHIVIDSGKWIQREKNIIELEYGESKIQFRREKSSLLMLDGDGNEIKSMLPYGRLARLSKF